MRDLRQQPFEQVLLQLFEQRSSGVLYLEEAAPSGAKLAPHLLRFERGAPVKMRPGDGHALLGELLVGAQLITRETLDDALMIRGLLGDVLVVAGSIELAALNKVLDRQFAMRVVRLFSLPAETTFRFEAADRALADWGGEGSTLDPFNILWLGLRYHGERSPKLAATLARLGDMRLTLHPAVAMHRFGFVGDEVDVLRAIETGGHSLPSLLASSLATESLVRRVVYLLCITRALALAGRGPPAGASELGPAAGLQTASLGRLRMTTSSSSLLAAAPDPPGDGERGGVPRPASITFARAAWTSQGVTAALRPSSSDANAGPPSSGRLTPPQLFQIAQQRLAEMAVPQAIEMCARAYAAEPENPEYASLYVRLKAMVPGTDLRWLAEILDPALKAHPDHAGVHYVSGILRVKCGDLVGAQADFKRVLEIDPSHRDAKHDLDLVHARQKTNGKLFDRWFKR